MNSNVKTESRIPVAFSIAMLLACAVIVSSAFADDQVRSETVKFADLNVTTPAGAEALYTPIHAAAQPVCPGAEPLVRGASPACAPEAGAPAVEQLGPPQLNPCHQPKSGERTQ